MPELTTPVVGLLSKLGPGIIDKMATSLQRPADDIRVRIQDLFGAHVQFTLDRCGHVKTIVSDEKPVSLRDIYVHFNLSSGNDNIVDLKLTEEPEKYNRCLIRGTAGAGKTMLMKYMALESFAWAGKLPIFIDLRDIPDPSQESFIRAVFSLATPNSSNRGYDVFNAGLRAGLFAFFFDGLDEIRPAFREKTFAQMHRFPFEFPKVRMLISSRPETEVSGFSTFSVFHLQPLNLKQAVDLVEKTDFHSVEKKTAFIEKLRLDLFENRKPFASNPLLCLLMLMTFSDGSEVPERAALFYEQAFDTLYSRHDSSKGPFRRIHKSDLKKDEFRRLFRMFCYRTLAKHMITLDEIDMRSEISRSVQICELGAQTHDVLHDFLESVCLMQRDGGRFHFIHRSFQEFFAADFLANYRGKDLYHVFDKILRDPVASRAAPLLYDLDRNLMEEVWIMPVLTELIDYLENSLTGANVTGIPSVIKIINVSDETGNIADVEWVYNKEVGHLASILTTIYKSTGHDLSGMSLIGVRMYPQEYRNIRDFIINDPTAPVVYKEAIVAEAEATKQANKERRSMLAEMIRGWRVDVQSPEIRDWVSRTELPNVIPAALAALTNLRSEVQARVSARMDIDLLN